MARIPEPDVSPEQFAQAVAHVYIERCRIYEKALRDIAGQACTGPYWRRAHDALREAEKIGAPAP